jgi:hypothetical protein
MDERDPSNMIIPTLYSQLAPWGSKAAFEKLDDETSGPNGVPLYMSIGSGSLGPGLQSRPVYLVLYAGSAFKLPMLRSVLHLEAESDLQGK